jgi:hypothetical protein
MDDRTTLRYDIIEYLHKNGVEDAEQYADDYLEDMDTLIMEFEDE